MFGAAIDRFTTTENGRLSLATSGNSLLDLFVKLVRDLSKDALIRLIDSVLHEAAGDPNAVVDLFVLWASSRDVRGGKGERQLSYWMLAYLASKFPATADAMVPLIPEYGSWKDVVSLLALSTVPDRLRESLVSLLVSQLQSDMGAECPSLCAKWAPREKSSYKELAKLVASRLFPEQERPLQAYRKLLSGLNEKLGTVETMMCSGNWRSIRPGSVPARCLKTHKDAFLNQKKEKPRHPHNEDRVLCAQQFVQHAEQAASDPSKARMHGRVLHPHEIVEQYLKQRDKHYLNLDVILEAQWADLRARLGEECVCLGKMVPLVDVSFSMSGTPMHVALALGILISEMSVLRDRFLTFHEQPNWHQMQPGWTLQQKLQSASAANWGGSTDFQRALMLILQACRAGEVPPQEIGELCMVVLSDMQFNEATMRNSWETQHQELVRSFKQAGLNSKWKTPYPVPKIVYWNLRGNTRDFVAEANTPGVHMVSGFSPNMLKLFMEGNLDECGAQPVVTPYNTMRNALDDERYDPVRRSCALTGEGCMQAYHFGTQ